MPVSDVVQRSWQCVLRRAAAAAARSFSLACSPAHTRPPAYAVIPFGLPGDGNGDAATIAAVKQVSWGFGTVAELSAARIRSKGYCSKCNVHRPLGAHHCNDCGHCVFAIDHHCPVFSTCIAGRNLPHFWFAIIAGVASIVVTALSGVATLIESILASQVSTAAVLVFVHGVALVETVAFAVIFGAYLVLLFCSGHMPPDRDPFGRTAWRPQRKCGGCCWYQPSLVGRVLNGMIVRPWEGVADAARRSAKGTFTVVQGAMKGSSSGGGGGCGSGDGDIDSDRGGGGGTASASVLPADGVDSARVTRSV